MHHPQLPDPTGARALVTGANTVTGKETDGELAHAGAEGLLAYQSTERAAPAIADFDRSTESIGALRPNTAARRAA